uniref:Uncharacterized protein n=1 Tax=Picea glauca TaxID=3330 RepID=A0A101LZ11_PICGL|nr:hypothetical protein ABT39_MTgene4812 [Picea glauca]
MLNYLYEGEDFPIRHSTGEGNVFPFVLAGLLACLLVEMFHSFLARWRHSIPVPIPSMIHTFHL